MGRSSGLMASTCALRYGAGFGIVEKSEISRKGGKYPRLASGGFRAGVHTKEII